jgi:hypothetical protein
MTPLEFSFGGFEISLGGLDVFLSAADFSGHSANLFLAFLLDLRQLRGELLVRSNLFLADSFRAALGLGKFRDGHAHFLFRNFDVALQIGEPRIGLFELRGQDLALVLLFGKILLQAGNPGIAQIAERS